MTWKSIFDLHTMQHQHIFFTYVAVLAVQAAYFARIIYLWSHPKLPQA
ncbi:MAG: hypothetical protein JWM43_3538 [Acidobacteriaceae bacterium]|nr:hypothetical protein [Acidobacteriaceae bacterium]